MRCRRRDRQGALRGLDLSSRLRLPPGPLAAGRRRWTARTLGRRPARAIRAVAYPGRPGTVGGGWRSRPPTPMPVPCDGGASPMTCVVPTVTSASGPSLRPAPTTPPVAPCPAAIETETSGAVPGEPPWGAGADPPPEPDPVPGPGPAAAEPPPDPEPLDGLDPVGEPVPPPPWAEPLDSDAPPARAAPARVSADRPAPATTALADRREAGAGAGVPVAAAASSRWPASAPAAGPDGAPEEAGGCTAAVPERLPP